MTAREEQLSMLRLLLAAGEGALEVFRPADSPLDGTFVADLERIVERTRDELEALTETGRKTR